MILTRQKQRAVYKISQAVSKAENQYAVGKELKAIKDETGIDVSIPNATPLSFEQYIQKLQMQAAAYRAESVKGNAEALRKATELEMRIMSESAEMVKSLAIETAKNALSDGHKRGAFFYKSISKRKASSRTGGYRCANCSHGRILKSKSWR